MTTPDRSRLTTKPVQAFPVAEPAVAAAPQVKETPTVSAQSDAVAAVQAAVTPLFPKDGHLTDVIAARAMTYVRDEAHLASSHDVATLVAMVHDAQHRAHWLQVAHNALAADVAAIKKAVVK